MSQTPISAIKERPILFSGPMIKAILANRKTQTRRIVKPIPGIVYGIHDDLLTCYYRDHDASIWSYAEADPCFAEQRLHGGERWKNLFANQICRLWEEGIRGLVSVSGTSDQEGLLDCFFVSSERQSNEVGASAGLHGISRDAPECPESGEALGREPGQLHPEQPCLGDANRELARSKDPRSPCQQPHLQIHKRGAAAFAVGPFERALQRANRGKDFGSKFLLRAAARPWQVGTKLWVRETWAWPGEEFMMYRANPDDAALYEESRRKHADNPNYPLIRWSPSIHMPRRVCRITLEITDVRVQRLQEISEEDAAAEGCQPEPDWTAAMRFAEVWGQINGKTHPWASNPWVWVVSFRRLEAV